MPVTTLFLGSIGALAETSDIQRRAYNQALADAGVAWSWDPDTYRGLLGIIGGRDRLRLLADATGQPLDDGVIAGIHARKTEIACAEVVETGVALRPGIAELVAHAHDSEMQLGLVTTTSQLNIDAIADAAGTTLGLDRFDVVITRDDVADGKPSPECYEVALERLDVNPEEAVAIEDTAASASAAIGAGITTIVTPGAFTDDQFVIGAALILPSLVTDGVLDPEVLQLLG